MLKSPPRGLGPPCESLDMKPLLNTLFVTTDGAYVGAERETVRVRVDGDLKARFPIHVLEGICCLGRIGISARLMELCGRRSVPISMLSSTGRFLARVSGPTSGNVLLRRAQYRTTDDPSAPGEIARAMVVGKVANCRTVLMRASREERDAAAAEPLRKAGRELSEVLERLRAPLSLDTVRGHEGEAAAIYFAVFDHLITAQKGEFVFRTRSRRPPRDPVNALLSFLYTLLLNDAMGACEAVGLDPAVGFLHRDRPGRPGLALDLMEELRPILADRLALTVINRKEVGSSGFRSLESGAVVMDDATRKTVVVAYQNRKREMLRHPFLDEDVPIGLLPHVQALLMARHLRGDLDGYPPFLWK